MSEPTKRCSGCGELKPLAEFYKSTKAIDGLQSRCKACGRRTSREFRRKRYQADPEKALEETRIWLEANPEKRLEYKRRSLRQRKVTHETVLAHYSPASPPCCACCGTTVNLSIDHVSGDGASHREDLFPLQDYRTSCSRLWYWLAEQGFPPGFQVLCKPCNSSKSKRDRCRLDHAVNNLKTCRCPEHVGVNPLPRDAFGRLRRQPDGLYLWCRTCRNRKIRADRASKSKAVQA
jgi:hypothetical protein